MGYIVRTVFAPVIYVTETAAAQISQMPQRRAAEMICYSISGICNANQLVFLAI